MGKIRRLPEEVIRRIAAGEVLLRPVNAVKELIENSLDAHSTSITITLIDGGLRGLTVMDDGDGILSDDLALLCERHATSKLHHINDMTTLSTFGFRGEALASMAVVGRVTCQSRPRDSNDPLALKASYHNGRLIGDIERVVIGGEDYHGTIISVDDLFYAFPERRKLFLSRTSEEHDRVFELVCKFAVAFAGRVGFTLRSKRNGRVDLQTTSSMTVDDVLRVIHGNDLADNVIIVKHQNDTLKLIHSNPYYRRKDPTITIFINDRLVEWSAASKMVSMVYSQLVLSGWHPWITILLTVQSDRVDANVSPTKHTVMLADTEDILEMVKGLLEESLRESGRSKRVKAGLSAVLSSPTIGSTTTTGSIAPYKRIYSDYRDTKIEHYFSSPRSNQDCTVILPSSDGPVEPRKLPRLLKPTESNTLEPSNENEENITVVKTVDNPFTAVWDQPSVRLLRDRLAESCRESDEVSKVLKRHVMVGVGWEGEKTFLQYETCLMVLNTRPFAQHYFYSRVMSEVGRQTVADLSRPVSIIDSILQCIQAGHIILQDQQSDAQKLAQECCTLLMDKQDLFMDYFGIKFENDQLLSLPVLINEPAIPKKSLLGVFMFRLAVEVPWGEAEDVVLEAICGEIGSAYSSLPFDTVELNVDYIKNRLFPALKSSNFGFPADLAKQGHIRLVTDLHSLYKVFDRC